MSLPQYTQTIGSASATDGSQLAIVPNGNVYFAGGEDRKDTLRKSITACRSELFLSDPAIDREDLISAKGERVDGTCEWIQSNDEYKKWRTGSSRLLWIRGGPGKGKTMMSIYLTQTLEDETVDDEEAHVLYFFCASADTQRNSATAILRTLLWQLTANHPELLEHVLGHFESKKITASTLSSRESLWRVLSTLLARVETGTFLYVIDGLDECDDESIRWLARKYIALTSQKMLTSGQSNVKIIIVSRQLPGLASCAKVKLDPDNDEQVSTDIERLIETRVNDLAELVYLDDSARDHVKETLTSRAGGTFLWVGYAMFELMKSSTFLEVQMTLKSLPSGLDALYERMLTKIKEGFREQCHLILIWVMYATQPITLETLTTVLSPDIGSDCILVQAARDLVALCGPMLRVEDNVVDLVHQSARDYILSLKGQFPTSSWVYRLQEEHGNFQIAKTCLNYMQHHRASLDLELLPDHSFILNYAVFELHTHANLCGELGLQLLSHESGFYKDISSLRNAWWKVISCEKRLEVMDLLDYVFESDRDSPPVPPLHMSIFLGFTQWTKAILDTHESPTISLQGAVGIERTFLDQTPLFIASISGRDDMVELLLEHGADINSRSLRRSVPLTPLEGALDKKHWHTMRLLLNHGALPNTLNSWGPTALSRALDSSDWSLVQDSLDHRVCLLDDRESYWESALCGAVNFEDVHLAGILLQFGATVNMVNDRDMHRVLESIEDPSSEAQRQLERHAPLTVNGKNRRTYLHLASQNSWTLRGMIAVNLLLCRGANPNAVDENGQSALHAAAKTNSKFAVPLLLKYGVNTTIEDHCGKIALQYARELGHDQTADMITAYGQNADIEEVWNILLFRGQSLDQALDQKSYSFFAELLDQLPLEGCDELFDVFDSWCEISRKLSKGLKRHGV